MCHQNIKFEGVPKTSKSLLCVAIPWGYSKSLSRRWKKRIKWLGQGGRYFQTKELLLLSNTINGSRIGTTLPPFTKFFDFWPVSSKLSQASLVNIFSDERKVVSVAPQMRECTPPIIPKVFFRHIGHCK